MGGTSIKEVRGAGFAGSAPPFLGRERAAVDVDVGLELRSPRYHESCLALESVKEERNDGFYSKHRNATQTGWVK